MATATTHGATASNLASLSRDEIVLLAELYRVRRYRNGKMDRLAVKRRALVEIVEQLQRPVQPMRKSKHAVPVATDHLLQQRQDFVDVGADPF
jgi:hypothetical protein